MSNDKQTRLLWAAAIAAILSAPLGDAIGLILSAGQDGPGKLPMHAFGDLVTVIVWVVSTCLIAWNPGKALGRLGKGARIAVVLSIFVMPATVIISASQHQIYDLRVWNDSGAKIDDVAVRIAGKTYSFGVMSNSVFATRSRQQNRPSGAAEISWATEDGQSQTGTVDLSGLVPRRYDNGVLTFTIDATHHVHGNFFIQPDLPF